MIPAIIRYTDNMPAHAGGMTRGPFIFIRPKYKGDIGLLEHEKTHVKQWWIVTLLAVAAILAIGHLCGLTSFWRVIYALPGRECKHLEQIERDGRILFALKYSWWTIRHGYWNNPYEVEARKAETQLPTERQGR